jgi:hypothetical protein
MDEAMMNWERLFKAVNDQIDTDAVWKSLTIEQRKTLLRRAYGKQWRKKFAKLIKVYQEHMKAATALEPRNASEEGLGYFS